MVRSQESWSSRTHGSLKRAIRILHVQPGPTSRFPSPLSRRPRHSSLLECTLLIHSILQQACTLSISLSLAVQQGELDAERAAFEMRKVLLCVEVLTLLQCQQHDTYS